MRWKLEMWGKGRKRGNAGREGSLGGEGQRAGRGTEVVGVGGREEVEVEVGNGVERWGEAKV